MGILTPQASPPEETIPGGRNPTVGGVLYGAAFVILAALIFTFILHPQAPDNAETAEANPPPMPTLPLTYPQTRTVDAFDVHFGVKVADPYRWLEDGKSPEVQAWLDAENKVARSYLDALPGRAALAKRYSDLLRIDTISAPSRAGDRYFLMKRKASQEKSVLYWRSASDPQSPEHVLIPSSRRTTHRWAHGLRRSTASCLPTP